MSAGDLLFYDFGMMGEIVPDVRTRLLDAVKVMKAEAAFDYLMEKMPVFRAAMKDKSAPPPRRSSPAAQAASHLRNVGELRLGGALLFFMAALKTGIFCIK
ncbi:hypothetical protein PLESTM_000473700 [Pleodorina starrii]|nr:hypothetical protein PLESTM_000473700 [Pleodorina starrii]